MLPSASCHSVISAITGCGVAGANSGLVAVARAPPRRGEFVVGGMGGGGDLAFEAALPEAAGHQDGVVPGEPGCGVGAVDGLGVDMVDLHPHMVAHARVAQRLVDRLVAV